MLFDPIVPVSPSSCPSITSAEPGRSRSTKGSGESFPYQLPSNEWNVPGVSAGARLLVGT